MGRNEKSSSFSPTKREIKYIHFGLFQKDSNSILSFVRQGMRAHVKLVKRWLINGLAFSKSLATSKGLKPTLSVNRTFICGQSSFQAPLLELPFLLIDAKWTRWRIEWKRRRVFEDHTLVDAIIRGIKDDMTVLYKTVVFVVTFPNSSFLDILVLNLNPL
ncbi:hypothetical protein TNCT_61761 [Trichonephila clavata]|uniref:Uncharacterized protein n=1 Tax=Trichonephila clavata TaxID=2740835 RepID=A0A8X6L6D2_TRICU|nr:hypothetical protein TNCT_61761 [Trichonephila clavata]